MRIARSTRSSPQADPAKTGSHPALVTEWLEQGLRTAARHREGLAVLHVAIDRLHVLAHQHGEQAGPAIRTTISGRLRDAVRAGDTVAELSDESFVVILPGAREAGALRVANKLRIAINAPIQYGDTTISMATSIGIALHPDHGDRVDTLLNAADLAMFTARAAGGGAVVHTLLIEDGATTTRDLVGDLRAAIAAGDLQLLYQPVINAAEPRSIRAEALVRWEHATLGQVPPDHFIPLAEHTGLIDALTVWVLEAALKQCRAWQDAGHFVHIAVNIAAQTLQDRQLPDLIDALLRLYEIAPKMLTLEVTERALMADIDAALPVLHALAARGVRLALDDFGVGHSSLASLCTLPVHELKVDRSFIHQSTQQGRALVKVILGMGMTLGLNVVVEGVEDATTAEWLREMGCQEFQGFFACRPLLAGEFTRWLTSTSS